MPCRAAIEDQINLRRQAIRSITLARLATPADDVIEQMAELLVKLVNLTPPGTGTLRHGLTGAPVSMPTSVVWRSSPAIT